MKRILVLLVALFCGTPVHAASPLEGLDASERPHLKSIYSSVHDISQFVKDETQAVAVVFLGTECPVARQYLPRLAELHNQYRTQGVQFLGVYSNVGDYVFEMAQHAHDEDIPFPALLDTDHRLADLLGTQTTPEVVLLNRKLEKVYQGAIDNQFQRHGRKAAATEHYLVAAIEAVLKGQPIEQPHVPASGCPLERSTPQRAPRQVTFHKEIAPLVQKNCQKCHRDEGPAPFELITFDDVAFNAEKIREVVLARRMPPWHGVLNEEFGKLANDGRLSDEEIETLVAWIDADAPEGDKDDAPAPIQWPAPSDWAIGKPDFVYRMPKPFKVPKSGTLEYQFFRVRMNLDQDRWFKAVEIKPGNPTVVHHITLHVAPSTKDQRFEGLATMSQLYGLNGEMAHLINDFLPGDTYNSKTYPADQAVLIPKNSDLVFEVHYTPNNREATTDQSMVAFQWAKAPPQHAVETTVFRRPAGRFRIPPHEHHYRLEDTYYFPHDVEIDAIRPHAHLRGKSFRLEIIKRNPDTDEIERRQTVLSVPVFDQAWQRTYELATPLKLPAGTELLATFHYDNSDLNPNNPDPSAEVLWGQQTTDEMFSTRFKYRLVKDSK